MKMKSKTQSNLVATLMMFASMAISLQPPLVGSGTGCTCDAKTTVEARVITASCCGDQFKQQQSCCSEKQVNPKLCCCNPIASVCECGSCGCSENDESNSPLPAIPGNETVELIVPTLICAGPFVGYPRECDVKRVGFPRTAAKHAVRSSQQTCVLLSRFTC